MKNRINVKSEFRIPEYLRVFTRFREIMKKNLNLLLTLSFRNDIKMERFARKVYLCAQKMSKQFISIRRQKHVHNHGYQGKCYP